MIECRHWHNVGRDHFGQCLLGRYGGFPSRGVCANCPARTTSWWKGLLHKMRIGTKIEKVTSAAGIPTCGGCKKRKAILDGELTHERS